MLWRFSFVSSMSLSDLNCFVSMICSLLNLISFSTICVLKLGSQELSFSSITISRSIYNIAQSIPFHTPNNKLLVLQTLFSEH